MLKYDVKKLLENRAIESNRIEYKEGFNPAEIIRTITAFANDIDNVNGGYILIGVKESNGRPVLPITGINPDAIDGIQKKLLEYCHSIAPLYVPRSEVLNYKNKTLLLLIVRPGYEGPYRCKKDVIDKNSPWIYPIRKLSSTVQANTQEIQELYDNASRIPFDDQMNPFATIKDIDRDLMVEHLKKIESRELLKISDKTSTKEIADDLELLDKTTGTIYPKNIGLLMFSKNPQKFFPNAFIEVVFLPDPTGVNIKEKKFTGPIQAQLYDALNYIESFFIVEQYEKRSDSILTKKSFNYPMEAIKELLANAVYHKSYQIQEPITVTITNTYMEIKSFPGLDRSISDENIAKLMIRSRKPYRNRRIGNFLKELHLTEGRNTGIPLAIKALRKNGSPDPVFDTDNERQSLIVRIYSEKAIPTKQDNSSRNSRTNKSDDELKEDIWRLLSISDLSVTELSKKLGYPFASSKVKRIVKEMKENKQVTIEGKGRSSKIKTARIKI